MKVKPLYDRVIIKRLEKEEEVRGSIIIPDTAKALEGEVIAVGKGKLLEDGKLQKLEVKKGDRVLVGKYSGNEIKIDDVEYLIVREDEILGIIEK